MLINKSNRVINEPGLITMANIKEILIGKQFPTSMDIHERLDKLRALAVFASDPISSNAYATEAIMSVLIVLGSRSLGLTWHIGLAVATLVILVIFSYIQTILHYPEGGGAYTSVRFPDGTSRRLTVGEKAGTSPLPPTGRVYRTNDLTSQSPGTRYEVHWEGRRFFPKGYWKTQESSMGRLLRARRVESSTGGLYYVRYFDDWPAFPIVDNWDDTGVAGFTAEKRYVVETSPKVIERCDLSEGADGTQIVYVLGSLYGRWPDETPFSGIRSSAPARLPSLPSARRRISCPPSTVHTPAES